MSAAITDLFTKVGVPGTATTLSAPGYTIGGTSLTVGSTTNWPSDTLVCFAIDRAEVVNGVEVRIDGSYNEFSGIVTGANAIGSLTQEFGVAQDYAAGALTRVYIPVSSTRENKLVQGLGVEHNPNGTHKALTTDSITEQTSSTFALKDTSGNEYLKTSKVASAVNEVTLRNAATGNAPALIASGGDSAINLNLQGKGLAKTVTIGVGAATIFPFDFILSGCVLSGDAYASTLNFSMTSGVVVINGNPVTVASFSASAATASRDTYVDVLDNGDGTGLVVKTGGNVVTNNAASPALASNSVRIGIVVSGAGNIAAATSVNQGQESRVLPIASSIPYAVTDSLGNLICPRDPNRKILGYRQILSDQTTSSGTYVDVTGLNLTVNIPTSRRVLITAQCGDLQQAASGTGQFMNIVDVTASSTQLSESGAVGVGYTTTRPESLYTPSAAGARNFKVQFKSDGTRTIHTNGGATTPIWVRVELA